MIRRLCDLPIRRLESVFDPPGLPLVAKSTQDRHTTSILVRGGPGTGKTTLALGLGQAIARDGGGVLVYMTTEFSPAEIGFKAELLGFETRGVAIWSWDGSTREATIPAGAGTIFVYHVTPQLGDEELADTSVAKKQWILETAWRLLGVEAEVAPRIADMQVCAVVIDAFILPDFGGDDAEVRADLVAFIQALEGVGISPILVEEVSPESPSWFPFIVDLVLQLSHQRSPEGELGRTLTCSKSRYALASAGPHVYALSEGTPALFPALRLVARSAPRVAEPLRFAFPAHVEGFWHVVAGQHVILHAMDVSFFELLSRTPGVRAMTVRFGTPSEITWEGGGVSIDDEEGPAVLGCAVLDAVTKASANTVFMYWVARFMDRDWWRLPTERLLVTLRGLGLVVVVMDEAARLRLLVPGADISIFGEGVKETSPPSPAGEQQWQLQIRQPRLVRFVVPPVISGVLWAERGRIPEMKFPGQPADHRLLGFGLLDGQELARRLRRLEYGPGWLLACALVAQNIAAMEPLEALVLADMHELAWFAAGLVHARAMLEGVEAAERCTERLLARAPWVAEFPWLLRRVRAELRLLRPESRSQGIGLLRELLDAEALSGPHRAECAYNLAIGLGLEGDVPGVLEAARAAVAANPHLAPAEDLLRRVKEAKSPE